MSTHTLPVRHSLVSLNPVVAMTDTRHLMLFRCNEDSGSDNSLRQLFARSDGAAHLLAPVPPRHQVLEVECLWIPVRLFPTRDVSVMVRSTRSRLSESAVRKIR